MTEILKVLFLVFLTELVGIVGSVFTIPAIPGWYSTLNKPFFSPPNWLFGPVWTLLYLMMAVSFYLVLRLGWKKAKVREALKYFLIQMTLNFAWSPAFFGLRSSILGLLIIICMWVFVLLTIRKFFRLSRLASYLLIPYFCWISFATVLNASMVI